VRTAHLQVANHFVVHGICNFGPSQGPPSSQFRPAHGNTIQKHARDDARGADSAARRRKQTAHQCTAELIKNLTIARASPPGNRDRSYRGHPADLQVRAEHVCTQGLFNRIASRTANDPIVGHKGTVSVCAARTVRKAMPAVETVPLSRTNFLNQTPSAFWAEEHKISHIVRGHTGGEVWLSTT
jgi:hypothetical protein